VQEGIYDRFVEAYKAAIEAKTKKTGDPTKADVEVGPLVDEGQHSRVSGFIERAKAEKQGTLLIGGRRIGTKVSSPNCSLAFGIDH
jgi:acyl-CoA reductase-like NAD-dependent aldehyde dehydrogenase